MSIDINQFIYNENYNGSMIFHGTIKNIILYKEYNYINLYKVNCSKLRFFKY